MNLFDEFAAPWFAQVSPGVSPGFVFAKDGNVTVGTHLRTGDVQTSKTGQPIFGTNKLIRMRVSSAIVAVTNTVIQLRKRTAVSTFSDIAGALITLSAGNYTATAELDIVLPENVELCAYNKSGSALSNVVLVLFLMPYS
jgi:hypothetical protein